MVLMTWTAPRASNHENRLTGIRTRDDDRFRAMIVGRLSRQLYDRSSRECHRDPFSCLECDGINAVADLLAKAISESCISRRRDAMLVRDSNFRHDGE